MDGYDIARVIAAIGALLILAPALFLFARNRQAMMQNPVFWFAVVGALVLVWTAVWQP